MLRWLLTVFQHPLLLPVAMVLLGLRRLRGIAWYQDLTAGDTSYYFVDALRWAVDGQVNIAWSPLYSIFSGTLYQQSGDPYLTGLMVRIGSVLLMAIAVGALLRRCLSAGVGLLIGAWWVFEPISFNTLYEIHLFSALGPVVALWITLRFPSPAGRASALALLTIWAFLQRNEYVVAVALAGSVYAWRDIWRGRAWRPYALAAALAALAVGVTYQRSAVKYPDLEQTLSKKHTLNVCQIYAFGYYQRDQNWTASPWSECSSLMQAKFGVPYPTMWEAVARNWTAMAIHFGWNLLLLPAGLEVLLFSQTSFPANPDYAPVDKTPWGSVYSVVVLAVWLAGAWAARKNAGVFSRLKADYWPPLVLGAALAASSLIVAVTQRPRPSYLLGLQVILMLVTGLALQALLDRWRWSGWTDWVALPLLPVLLVAMPVYYTATKFPQRSLLTTYRRLADHRGELLGRNVLTPSSSVDICNYLATRAVSACQGALYYALRGGIAAEGLQRTLENQGIQVVYLDAAVLAEASTKEWLPRREAFGWVTLAEAGGADPWLLVRKR